jgi:hypothetical protein
MSDEIRIARQILHMPFPDIVGCRPDSKNYNLDSKPREKVTIRFSSLPTFEAAAEFYSYLAYPDQIDATNRENYRIALSRWAVLERAKLDNEWKESTEMERSIRPLIFSQSEKFFESTRIRGGKIWWDRAVCASMMLLPQLAWDQFDELPPEVRNIALSIGRSLGYSEGSEKTVESKVWARTKPVAHAAAAAMLSFGTLRRPEQEWDEEQQLCRQQPFLATLFYEDVFKDFVLTMAEILRLQLPSCTRFRIRENEIIQFVAG